MDSNKDFANHNVDYLTLKEREIVSKFNPDRITSAFEQDKIFTEILTSEGLVENQDQLSAERRRMGALVITMIQQMDDVFDGRRHTFKKSNSLLEKDELLEKLMLVNTNIHPDGATVADLLNIVLKASTNNELYPIDAQRLIAQDIDYLRTTVVTTLSDTEKNPKSVNFEQALNLRRVTNGGEAALMFDLSFGQFVKNPNYFATRQKVVDMSLVISLADDVSDFTEDMNGEKVNSFLSCTRDTHEHDSLMSVFRTRGFRKQTKRGELQMSEILTAMKLAPKAYRMIYDTQKGLLDSVGSKTLTTFYSILQPKN